jgi:hypothetical protein
VQIVTRRNFDGKAMEALAMEENARLWKSIRDFVIKCIARA